jgi:hypothetical protein
VASSPERPAVSAGPLEAISAEASLAAAPRLTGAAQSHIVSRLVGRQSRPIFYQATVAPPESAARGTRFVALATI